MGQLICSLIDPGFIGSGMFDHWLTTTSLNGRGSIGLVYLIMSLVSYDSTVFVTLWALGLDELTRSRHAWLFDAILPQARAARPETMWIINIIVFLSYCI